MDRIIELSSRRGSRIYIHVYDLELAQRQVFDLSFLAGENYQVAPEISSTGEMVIF